MTRSSCCDIKYTERKSRYNYEIATTMVIEEGRENPMAIATSIAKTLGRDNIRLSRQQLYKMEVATTPGCRDTSCKDQKVATLVSCRDVNLNEKRSRQDQVVRHQLHLRHVVTTQRLLLQGLRQDRGRDDGSMSRQYQSTGPVN